MKLKIYIMVLLAVFLLAACTKAPDPKQSMPEIYSIALDAYMPIDDGLNSEMKYIAIDMSDFQNVDEQGKQQILDYFKKYNVQVMEATYEQLKEKKLLNPETGVLDGVLLRVEKIDVKFNKVIIEGDKYRAGNGAIGTRVEVQFKDGKWQVIKADGTWIS